MTVAELERRIAELERRIAAGADVLDRQLCQCLDARGRPATGSRVKVQCVRCEALARLAGDPR